MGCLESKSKKNKAKPLKIPKNVLGENNIKWKRLLQCPVAFRLIIDDINGTAQHPAYKAIDKDVLRTFPNQQFFKNQSNVALFKETLKCLALTFPKLGYTQGLNFLAGYLLLNKMKKLQCLTLLTCALAHPSLMFLGLYEDGFPLAHLYCQLFWKLLKKIDTQLYDYLKNIGIPDHMWIFQWYLTFFLYSFPIQYVSFFMNNIFEHKQFQMVKISVAIALCLKKDILQLPEKDEFAFIEYLQNLKNIEACIKMFDVEESIQRAQAITSSEIQRSLAEVISQKEMNSFYVKYFCSKMIERRQAYKNFIRDIEDKKEQLTNSKNDQKLMQSYKRSREKVQILDEIMVQSINRQMNRKYKSSLIEFKKDHANKNLSFRKWKSVAHISQESENDKEGQTTVSIVKKMLISQDDHQ